MIEGEEDKERERESSRGFKRERVISRARERREIEREERESY